MGHSMCTSTMCAASAISGPPDHVDELVVNPARGSTMTQRKQETHLDELVQQLEILASQVSSQYALHLSGPRADPDAIQRADEGIKRVHQVLRKMRNVRAMTVPAARDGNASESEWLMVWANVRKQVRSFSGIARKVLIEYRVVKHWQHQTAAQRMQDGRMNVLRTSQWRTTEVDDWSGFDIFKICQTFSQPLVRVFMAAWLNRGLHLLSRTPETKVVEFVTALEAEYKALPYHNSMHAADVTAACYYFETQLQYNNELPGFFTDVDALCLLVAGAVHDVAHPGLTNDFLVKTRHDLALRYNDKSVLENFHAATAFQIMQRTGANILDHNLPSPKVGALRGRVIDMVLATDMANHKNAIAELTAESVSCEKPQDISKLVLERCLVKAADIGHALRPFKVHEKWSHCVATEFLAQGDREKLLGFTPLALMDRTKAPPFAKGQLGFLNFMVVPFWRVLGDILGHSVQEQQACLEDNLAQWGRLADKAEADGK
mmetsp:Transcript_15710/g.42827  ORF Transcript_15710/g.42827 Transcript_15710/m.42827 type:complete len:490 (-) Transcript_15710:461-1930(-)